jgi:hypothetical protein
VFDGTILATAALAAPGVMVESGGTILASFDDLSDEEREILFETFRVWQETDASMGGAAERLCCHRALPIAPNRAADRPISLATKGCRRTMFGIRGVSPAHLIHFARAVVGKDNAH